MSIFRRFLFIYLYHLHSAFQTFKTIFFKSETYTDDTNMSLFKISTNGIYTGFCAVVGKFLFLDFLLIHQLWLLGSQQHPQSGVFQTSFQFEE